MANKNAVQGAINETIVASAIQNNSQAIEDIVCAFTENLPNRKLKATIAEREGQHGEKSDVFVRVTGGNNFGMNIKSFKGSGFNQVTRMTIDNFAKQYQLSNNIRKILKELTIAKAKNSRQNWITPEYANIVVTEIRPKAYEIIRYSLLGEDSPELFVLLKSDESIIWIYKMDDLLTYLHNSIDVMVTPRGVLMLNECFSIQKKGGNGKREKYPKDDLRHGGNNIQVKMKTGMLASKLTPITTLYC